MAIRKNTQHYLPNIYQKFMVIRDLILDEPTVGIDYQNVEKFYKLLHQLNKEENITLLLISHDTGVMTEYASDVACLNKTMHFHGNTKEYSALSTEYLSEIYGHPVQVIVHDHE